ncbi:MAG: pyridoxal-phosphate dependent enzyme [Candidatus Peregrinibacteria bacterium]|nr:pyridoxal-phosphate dependent enzyme [Candidatus Peregrinibacteria bacterium]MDZ4245438.1 pyridoxal-phosphate dependent enzyme [Candidatus Gracilibacteria bacterium]
MQDHFSEKNTPTEINSPGELSERLLFFIKREDLHTLGSHKHFAASVQIKDISKSGLKGGVISTSGNAGICLIHYAKDSNVNIYVLTSDKCKLGKLEMLTKECKNLFLSKNPARLSNYIAAKYGLKNLRPSMDDLAVSGFEGLGRELYEQYLGLKISGKLNEFWKEIYTFSTSGASYIGMYNSFKKLKDEGFINTIPKMHCVTGFAGNLGSKHSLRKKQINEILKLTNGRNIEINEEELITFKMDFPKIELSEESLSAMAAALKNKADETSLVISTGKKWKIKNPDFDKSVIPRLDSFEDCDRLFS